ncbi:MAG: immunoglobulin domain-containing protein [Clostridiales bacterium]|nr:immunoglobulin domain-containing protein [Clostridiales bacterium]
MNWKKAWAVAASAATFLILVITGTLAWTNFNQSALNEWQGSSPEIGGTLHDDFCQPNKDIYVENWGEHPFFVRVKLEEYMEMGDGAGVKLDPVSNKAVSLAPGADIDDTDTWKPYNHGNEGEVFRDYWKWTMGGSKYYFPAPESLRQNGGDGYIDSLSPEDIGPFDINEYGVHSKETPVASIMTIAQWNSEGCPMGYIWVLDSDGWAYWAAPVLPGQATGLLLDNVELVKPPIQDYYYGINVKAQMATKDGKAEEDGIIDNYTKFGLEENGGWTPEGEGLMERIAGSQEITAVVITSDKSSEFSIFDAIPIYVKQGETVTLTAGVVTGSGPTAVTWYGNGSSGFKMTTDGNTAVVKIDREVTSGDMFDIIATSLVDPTKYDSKRIVVFLAAEYTVSTDRTGRAYADYGDNTFKMMEGGEPYGNYICGGLDLVFGTGDDLTNVVVINGVKYLTADEDGKYLSKGPDGRIGTNDDPQIGICSY